MNKLSIIFLIIIITLGIALGVMFYLYLEMRNDYIASVNYAVETGDAIYRAGARLEDIGNGKFELVIDSNNK